MKKARKCVSFVFLVSILSMVLNVAVPVTAYAENGNQLLYVSGKGGVKVMPDIAYVSLVASTKEDDAKTAQSKNNTKISAIIAKLKSIGIAEEDINTSNYTLTQNKVYINKEYQPDGYTAACTIRVTVRDLDSVGASIDSAIVAGASKISGIQFAISDTTLYYAQALDIAGKDAKSKAEALAKSLGVTIKSVFVIEELGTNYAPVSYSNTLSDEAIESIPMGDIAMPVQADELSVTASIKVTFLIE